MSSTPITVEQAAELAECCQETVRRALRSGELHGRQRSKGGTWKMRRSCVKRWAANELCKHQELPKPVSLHGYRTNGRRTA